jgi:hypothetical protein
MSEKPDKNLTGVAETFLIRANNLGSKFLARKSLLAIIGD